MEKGASAEKRFGSTLFWRLFAAINLVTVAWVGWVIWQITPSPVVYDFVLRMPVSQRSSSGTIPAVPPAAPAGVATVTPVAPPAPLAEIPIQSGPPMTPLRLETEIKAPPKK
jgi:hypothetical protein